MTGVESPDVAHQVRFTDGGGMEKDEYTESDLVDWGFAEGEQERETKYLEPEASEFGEDDRAQVEQVGQTEQDSLFMDVEQDQVTLSGGKAANKAKYE